MAKRGRPTEDTAKRAVIGIRMDEKEVARLDKVCRKNKMGRTDLIRAGIQMFYEKNG